MKNKELIAELVLREDEDGLKKRSNRITVDSASSYLKARRRIRRASQSGNGPIEIYVLNERYWDWLRDLREIGKPEFVSRRESARLQLEEEWEAEIPSDLTSEEIRNLGLLDLQGPKTGSSTTEYILEQLLDSVWLQEPSASHAALLSISVAESLSESDDADSAVLAESEWLSQKQRERTLQWSSESEGYLRTFYNRFSEDPEDACKLSCAAVFSLTLNNEQDEKLDKKGGSTVLEDFASDLSSGPHETSLWLEYAGDLVGNIDTSTRYELENIGRQFLDSYLLVFWKTILLDLEREKERLSVSHLLDILPGRSLSELSALEQYIEESSQVFSISNAQRKEFEEKYGTLGDGADRVRSLIQRNLVPPLPPEPGDNCLEAVDLNPWKDWLKQFYFPFKQSIDNQKGNISRETIREFEERALKFSDWYVDSYQEVVYGGENFVTSVLGNVVELAEKGKKVVWVIWDNLTVANTEKVVNAAKAEGLHPTNKEKWCLSALPTVTEVGLPALLSGNADMSKHKEADDRSSIVDENIPDQIEFEYSNSLKDIGRQNNNDSEIFILHYREYDRKKHKKEHKLEEKREKELQRLRNKVIEKIGKFASRISSESGVVVAVSSDHGSTLLPEQSKEIQLPDEIKHCTQYKSNRAVKITGAEDNVRDIFDEEIATVLSPEEFGLGEYHAIARGYSSFGGVRSNDGFEHGGALPEEVLTPYLVFEPSRPEFTQLGVRVVDSELRRGEERPLRIKISNPNDETVSPVYVRLSKEREIVKDIKIDSIYSNTSEIIEPLIRVSRFDEIENGNMSIGIEISANFLGQAEEQRVNINATAKERAVDTQTGENLGDFFE